MDDRSVRDITFMHTVHVTRDGKIGEILHFLLPGSLQSFRLRLKDLVRDILIGCLSDGPRREDRPEGWEVEDVGPEALRWS